MTEQRAQDVIPALEELIPNTVFGCLKLVDVSFSYPSRPDVRVYNHVTCEFPEGKTTAIVGASGAGKSMCFHALHTLAAFQLV